MGLDDFKKKKGPLISNVPLLQLSESLGSIWFSYNKVISRKIELGEV